MPNGVKVRVGTRRPRGVVRVVVITAVLALLGTMFVGVAGAAAPKAAPKAAAPNH